MGTVIGATRRAALPLALLAACSVDLGPTSEWVPWDSLEGELRPEVGDSPQVPAPDGRLRVVTYNVHYGEDVEGFARVFQEHPELALADVLMLQEIEDHTDEPGSRARRLAEALGMGFVYAPARLQWSGTSGLAILTRYPLENIEVMTLPFADFDIKAGRRIALAATLRMGGLVLRLVNVHLDTRLNITDRLVQLRPAVIEHPDQVVIGGDFNSNPYVWSGGVLPVLPVSAALDHADQAEMVDELMRVLGFATPTAGLGATQDAWVAELRLDAIYPRDLEVVHAAVEDAVDLSDHWPVWVEVVFP